jgi:hypothetical protein
LKDEQFEYMRINGDIPKLGTWNKGTGPVKMTQSKREVTWLTGEKVKPWTYELRLSHRTTPYKVVYKYSIMNEKTDV